MPDYRKILVRLRRLVIHHVLHIDDSPERLARGVGLGVLVGWSPAMGLHMLMYALLAPACRANLIVGLPVVWISNPVTFIPICFFNFWVGRKVLHLFGAASTEGWHELRQALVELVSGDGFFTQIFTAGFWHQLVDIFWIYGSDLWLGSLICGLPLAIIAYIASYRSINWYRTHTPRGRRFLHRRLKNKTDRQSPTAPGDPQ